MSNEENPRGRAPEHGGWEPTPQGEYDAEATGFFQLPPEGSQDGAPLAAPGHGYVPPMIMPLTPVSDPSVPEGWHVQQPTGEPETVQWPEPGGSAGHGEQYTDRYSADAHVTGQWSFTEGEPAPASDVTGQWTIPVAQGDLPEESGEFAASLLQSQWGSAPATLPGGASAPWASEAPATLPGGAPAPWATAPAGGSAADDERTPEPEAAEPPPAEDAPVEHASAEHASAEHASAEHASAERREEGSAGEPSRDAYAPEPSASAEPAESASSPEPAASADAPLSSTGTEEHPPTSYVLRVNGADRPVTDAWIGESLLYVLRERLGLAGAKDGCSQGECGACNVQVDGRLVASCLVPAATAAGSEVRTVEGLAGDGEPSDVQRALAACGAVQCGFCIPGIAMTVHDLLEGNHAPSELETRQALCGNLCRCSGYRGVLDAVKEVVAERGASAAAAAEASEEARIPHQAPPGAGSVQPHPHDGGMA
ncbi:2Fe-2S iron-sulfur cluster-binding protein [Streptomyces sp. NPDC008141]|uniref:(2Fe-2S)-binding protein n=1 Tax=Streptomyces sp. NPDC008141 TaxID=3364815 RepID=UPI0036EE53A8